ncbi:hypothetical protein O6072_21545 [Mycolicibacterium neoaurum]|uniref:hypothetical protein n=1 Tax=Mycolicibacterium neoaurum TaxID=1795 RepID=UPI00248C32E8|nr:hypothetical protein [Mycolicibacterium neoaurum]WBP93605.1 hypothetical protein O7W24_21045 [Mycolicibacterium neoaurum]WBS07398.1 hypothetical protein O6072_21545 [Mycolicibacterium neoaurum]
MAPTDPFDFSDFGPAGRPGGPVPGPGPSGTSSSGHPGGFDPWAGQPAPIPNPPASATDTFGNPSGTDTFGPNRIADAFGSAGGLGAPALTTSGPPLIWMVVALLLAVCGCAVASTGALAGAGIATALTGWLLAGPVAIGAVAVYNRVDTRRRTASIYSAPRWISNIYWVVLVACLAGITVSAWQIAMWAGRL